MEGYGNENPGAFQPTRPLRGATLTCYPVHRFHGISTHAPLAGRDWSRAPSGLAYYISTHAPLAGRDLVAQHVALRLPRFQPTRPLRGATVMISDRSPYYYYFNPRAPCGARLFWSAAFFRLCYFNPRAPCGARPRGVDKAIKADRFQPTRPLRGATALCAGSFPWYRFQPTRPLRGATGGVVQW